MNNKRTSDKVRYKKNKDFDKNSDAGTLTDSKWLASETDIKETMAKKQAYKDLENLKQRGTFPKIPNMIPKIQEAKNVNP